MSQMEKDAFHHDQGRIHDDPEIDGAQGNQVGGLPDHHHHRKGEQQGHRNGQRDNERGAQMPQEHEEDDKHEDHAADQNIRDGLDRRMDQCRAIIERLDLDAFRQLPLIQLLDLFPNAIQDRECLIPSLEQNDPFHHVVIVIDADLAQAHAMADRHAPQGLDENRGPFFFGDHHVFDVRQPVDQPESADVVILCAHGQVIPADIGIAVGQGLHDLRKTDLVADEFSRIDINVILLRRSAEGRHIDDPGYAPELSPQLPVLDSLEVGQARLPVPLQLIPIDFGNGPPGR